MSLSFARIRFYNKKNVPFPGAAEQQASDGPLDVLGAEDGRRNAARDDLVDLRVLGQLLEFYR
jgi:hypothetical protein